MRNLLGIKGSRRKEIQAECFSGGPQALILQCQCQKDFSNYTSDPVFLLACHFQRFSQPSHGTNQYQRWFTGFMNATSFPHLCSIFRTLGFCNIVPHEAGFRMTVTCSDTAGLQKPFHRRMGSLGSQGRGAEPTATVLTAGSTKQSTPHYCCMTLCGHEKFKPRCQHYCATR